MRTDNFELIGWFAVGSESAEWKSDLLLDSQDFTQIKILFEPRLPIMPIHKSNLLCSNWNSSGRHGFVNVQPNATKVIIDKPESLNLVLKTPGVLWVEPVLSTNAKLLHQHTWVIEILL